ncbi:hypothetical protein TNIN_339651 [Trichonephila inaurata madagascariensis]|uniref:Uncharacterized protein n=1 Tax=Trichonephila inaurata madagascariensis TaxID=2747483 RepID=A0A8X6I5E1_9ARAC|nr:hypothetical protein TNIN_339651 [Trichonephila inaurata madagascariensis]
MTEFHHTLGDKKQIPELEALVKDLIDEKEKLVSELRHIPPCLDTDCLNHPLLKSTVIDPELTNPKIKKQSQKRKTQKENSDGFAFPKKTARPITPTKVLEPVQTQNNFENLTQDPEINVDQTLEKETPKPRSPLPITLRTSKNYRDQLKKITETFPDIKIKTAGDYIKLFANTDDEISLIS